MRRKADPSSGMSLVEVLVAIGLATTVTLIVAQILVNTAKFQKRTDLRTDLQAFTQRLSKDLDCGKTFASIPDPTDANCQYLTLKSSSGADILTPDPAAEGVFVGAGPITKNWWGMARCDAAQRSIVIYVAMKDAGSWGYGKDPVRASNDASDVLQLQHWTAPPSPLFGATGKAKLCESYFSGSTSVRDCSQSPSAQYVTGMASGDSVTCAPLATPDVAQNCGSGKVAYGFDMQTNKPKCRSLTTTDLSAISGIQTWLKQQVVPNCSDSQVYVADTASPNTMKCASTYKARRCYNSVTKDYFPSTANSCDGAPSVGWTWDGGYFDFSVLPATIP